MERDLIRSTLYSDRFVDRLVREVYATLLDDGEYLGSVSTMYRLLRRDRASRERRGQRRHPKSLAVPEEHPRPFAGHPEGGPSHLAPVLSASSSIGLITKAENQLKPKTSGQPHSISGLAEPRIAVLRQLDLSDISQIYE